MALDDHFIPTTAPARAALLALLLTTTLATGGTPDAQAQTTEAFSRLELRLGGVQNVNQNFVHEFWNPGEGGEAVLSTPFYLGYLEVGGAFHPYEALPDAGVPNFDAVLLYTGWGLALDVADRLRLEASGRLGNYYMSFDEVTFSGVKNENELALMAQARLAVRPVGPVSVYVAGSYMQVYTFVRLKLWYASAGLSYRISSPNWLKGFLR